MADSAESLRRLAAEPDPPLAVRPVRRVKRAPKRPGDTRWITRLAAIGVLIGGVLGLALAMRPQLDKILTGVIVETVSVGGMSTEEARRVLAERLRPVLNRTVPLEDGERTWHTTPRDLGWSLDLDATLAAASAVGRQGNLLRQAADVWAARRSGVRLEAEWVVDRDTLARALRRVAEKGSIPAQDASVRFNGRQFLISPEANGRVIDAVETEKNIVRYFQPFTHRSVRLVTREDVPRVKAEDLERIDARLASFTTRFNPGDVNRSENLRLAAEALDGAVVPAGGLFSYNRVVGPRLESRGYRVAKIFLKGEVLDGLGGGVCQVSTTLYNAALECSLRIVERARHSRPVTYAPPDRDAAVSYGGVDFKFRNTTDAPLLIQTRVAGSALTVSIYGNSRFKPSPKQTAGTGATAASG